MSYFEDIVKSRDLGDKDFYLWQLKLTKTEYENLRRIIAQAITNNQLHRTHREATLYFAEWWRREFNGGHAKYQEVCESLYNANQESIPENIEDISQQLYNAARAGAEALNLQIIHTQRENVKYSIYFQGGLPMNYLINEVKLPGTSPWESFFKKLVWNQIDFSSSDAIPGIIAQDSRSLYAFCDSLRTAADNLIPSMQPYVHEEEWWNVVIKNFEEEKRARKVRLPFESAWIFDLDEYNKTIDIKYALSGSQWLSEEFVNSHNLTGRTFTSFSLKVNGISVFTPEYNERFYCRRTVKRTIPYKLGDSITITINETGEVLCNRALDLDAPRIIYLHDKSANTFRFGAQQDLKDKECRIIASEEWESSCEFEFYYIGGAKFKVFTPAIGIDKIPFLNKETQNELLLDPLKSSIKTFIDFGCSYRLGVLTAETLFNAANGIRFYAGESEATINTNNPCPVLYAEVGKQSWGETPKIGRIKAKARIENNDDIESVRFINTGNLHIRRLNSSRSKCEIEIKWEHGQVSSTEATQEGDTWIIRKADLSDGRHAHFLFTPTAQHGNEFTLKIAVPFYGFAIYDKSGMEVANNAIIPLIDLSDFEYFAHPLKDIKISPNRGNFELSYKYYINDTRTRCIVEEQMLWTTQRKSEIQFEGRLASLFMDGSEQIETMLNHSCRSLPDAEAMIIVKHSEQTSQYRFKSFPYRLKYDFESKLVIVKNLRGRPRYDAELLAIPIDCPESDPIELREHPDEQNRYYLPDTILSSAHRKWLIYGKLRGYILPFIIDTQTQISNEEREQIREQRIIELKQELLDSDIMSPIWKRAMAWFKRIPLGRIPGSSILELVAIADDNRLVERFALLLWLDCIYSGESTESLKSALIEFQTQMSFLWIWGSKNSLGSFFDPLKNLTQQQILPLFYQWFCSLPNNIPDKDKETYLTDPQYRNMLFLLLKFYDWYDELQVEGYPRQRLTNPDLNRNGDRLSSETARAFFAQTWTICRKHKNNIADRDWIIERHLASKIFEAKNFGDIEGSENVKREIRKSTILGLNYKIEDDEL